MSAGQHPVDRFSQGVAVLHAAFAWGLAEATVFFIVPDVLLTLIGRRSIRMSLKAAGTALVGAVLGGSIMFAAGSRWPEASRSWLAQIPAIRPSLIERVQTELSERGLGAVLIGPTRGIPYKIYAIEWGARHGSWPMFVLVSIPARGFRFLLSGLLAGIIARLIAPWTHQHAQTEIAILTIFWVGFYAFYFAHFGW